MHILKTTGTVLLFTGLGIVLGALAFYIQQVGIAPQVSASTSALNAVPAPASPVATPASILLQQQPTP